MCCEKVSWGNIENIKRQEKEQRETDDIRQEREKGHPVNL